MSYTHGSRAAVRSLLMRTGLLGISRRVRRQVKDLTSSVRDSDFRIRRRSERQRYKQFKEEWGNVFKRSPTDVNGSQQKVLILSRHFTPIEIQLVLVKALELAGYLPVVLTISRRGLLREYYRLAGVKNTCNWETLIESSDFSSAAESVIERAGSVEELLEFEYAGTCIGKTVVATALHQLRTGSLDLGSPEVRKILANQFAASMAAAYAALIVLKQVGPQLMLTFDAEYTPGCELFNQCIENEIDVVTYRKGHKRNTLILKRYSSANRDQNPVSLSEESWDMLKAMHWKTSHRKELRQEIYNQYARGDTWSGVTTQLMSASAIRDRLGLSADRKTAVIFPHIPWDASLRWGADLFRSYEHWLMETVRVACENTHVNWVIKIHPANVSKQGHQEPAEVVALKKAFGALPQHISVIPADSDISTYSLFSFIDYCVTVRGTTGIEAASFGIPVVTAGTGRYERKGFTIDSNTCDQYLNRIARIQEIPRLSTAEQELAERYAYGIFLLRPLPLSTIELNSWVQNELQEVRINVATNAQWRHAPELRAFAQWLNSSHNPDFLNQ